MSEDAVGEVQAGLPERADTHAMGRRLREQSEHNRRQRISRRSALIMPGLLFDEIRPDINIEPEPLGYEATRRYGEQVRSYFEIDLELFPDFFGGLLPRDYFRIYRDEIEEKFRTDTLARDLAGQLRHVMNKNFVSLIIVKRLLIIAASLLLLLEITLYQSNKATIVAKPWTGLPWIADSARDGVAYLMLMLICLGLFTAANTFLFMNFEHKSKESCSKVGIGLQSILKSIESAYRDALENIRSDEDRGEIEKDEWPDRAAWWARLILWYPKRIEYIEKTFQISMWRVRNWFAWCYIGGMAALLLVAAMIIGVIWRVGQSAVMSTAISAFVLILCAISYYFWRPSLNFVRDQTRVANWDRFSRFRVDDRLAEMLRRDKIKIITEQRRQRGGHT